MRADALVREPGGLADPAQAVTLRGRLRGSSRADRSRARSAARARDDTRASARSAVPDRSRAGWISSSTSRATASSLGGSSLERAERHHAERSASTSRASSSCGRIGSMRPDSTPRRAVRSNASTCARITRRYVSATLRIAAREGDRLDQQQVAPPGRRADHAARERVRDVGAGWLPSAKARRVNAVDGALPHRLEQQLELAAEVRVDRAGRDAGARGDAGDGRRLVALARELRDRGVEQRVAGARARDRDSARAGRSLAGHGRVVPF